MVNFLLVFVVLLIDSSIWISLNPAQRLFSSFQPAALLLSVFFLKKFALVVRPLSTLSFFFSHQQLE